MKINYSVEEAIVKVSLDGELDTPAAVEIQPVIDNLLEYTSREICVDCSKLTYLASSGLRQFIMLYKRCEQNGGKMILEKVTPVVMEIFSMSAFDKVFTIR